MPRTADRAPAAAARAPATRHRRGRRWLRRVLGALVALAVVLLVALGAGWAATPSVADAPQLVAAGLAAHGAGPLAPLPSPDRVGAALVAAEDGHFYAEPGIDPVGAVRAVVGSVFLGRDIGGATLPQQLAKLVYTPGRDSLRAQAEQVVLAVKLSARYAKAEILDLYENACYYGHGYYGVAAAARGYFGLAPSQLSWAQASLLAGLVNAPSAYDPLRHYALARSRQGYVLDRLVADGVLTRAAAAAAAAAPLHLTG